MYRLMSDGKLVGDFEKITFNKVNPNSGCFIHCTKDEAEGLVAGDTIYSLTDSEHYQNFKRVAVFELDSEVERSAELDYLRVMANLD